MQPQIHEKVDPVRSDEFRQRNVRQRTSIARAVDGGAERQCDRIGSRYVTVNEELEFRAIVILK